MDVDNSFLLSDTEDSPKFIFKKWLITENYQNENIFFIDGSSNLRVCYLENIKNSNIVITDKIVKLVLVRCTGCYVSLKTSPLGAVEIIHCNNLTISTTNDANINLFFIELSKFVTLDVECYQSSKIMCLFGSGYGHTLIVKNKDNFETTTLRVPIDIFINRVFLIIENGKVVVV